MRSWRWFLCCAVLLAMAGTGCSSGGGAEHGDMATPMGVSAAENSAEPARSIIPADWKAERWAVTKCAHTRRAADDPIVHRGHTGASHLHDFYGARHPTATTDGPSLAAETGRCDAPADRSTYWHPAISVDGRLPEPNEARVYYAATDRSLPLGLEMVSAAGGWACGSPWTATNVVPHCPVQAPTAMVVRFPDCWDGQRLRSADRSHVAVSIDGQCPAANPVPLPRIVMTVGVDVWGAGHRISLSSGGSSSAHGDVIAAWQPGQLAAFGRRCAVRGSRCSATVTPTPYQERRIPTF